MQRHRDVAVLLVALSLLTLITLREDGSRVPPGRAVSLAAEPAEKSGPNGLQAEKVAQLYREEVDDEAKAQTALKSDRPQTAKRYRKAASKLATQLTAQDAAVQLRQQDAETADAAVQLGRQDAEIAQLKTEMKAYEAKNAGGGGGGGANGGGGDSRRSSADVAQAIGEAILQHDPKDRTRLARELETHKLLDLALTLDPDFAAAKGTAAASVPRGSFGLPVLTSADTHKLPGVNLGAWSDPRVDLARQYGARSRQQQASATTDPAFRLSRSQLRLVASILDREVDPDATTVSGYARAPGGSGCPATHVCAFNADCTPNPRAAGFNRASNSWDYHATYGASGRHDAAGVPDSRLRSGGQADSPGAWHFTTGDVFRPDASAQTRPDPLSNTPLAGGQGDAPTLVPVNSIVKRDRALTEELFSVAGAEGSSEGGQQLASFEPPPAVEEEAEVECGCPRCYVGARSFRVVTTRKRSRR